MIRSSFRFCGAMLAASFLVTAASARPQMTAPATTEGDFVVRNFKFHSGESLPDVRLHYTTLGKPARDAQGRTTNAVLILHGTSGSGQTTSHVYSNPTVAPVTYKATLTVTDEVGQTVSASQEIKVGP